MIYNEKKIVVTNDTNLNEIERWCVQVGICAGKQPANTLVLKSVSQSVGGFYFN